MKIVLVRIDPLIGSEYHSGGGAIYNLKAYLLGQKDLANRLSVDLFAFDSLQKGDANIKVAQIYEKKPQLVGFSCYCWNMDNVLRYSMLLKKLQPDVIVVVGGPEVSFNSEEILAKNPQIDIIVRGEGEVTFGELVRMLVEKSKSDLRFVEGISFRKGDKVVKNPDRPLLKELDNIPSPFIEGIVDLTCTSGEVTIETARGCPFHCNYCLYHKNMLGIRSYSWKRIESELKFLCKSKSVTLISFADPTFNYDEKRALRILEIIKKYNRKVGLSLELRAELLTDELIEQLGHLNIVELAFGLQTISSSTNLNLNRVFIRERFQQNIQKIVRKMQGKDVRIDVDLIYGLPGDDVNEYKRSVDFVISLGAHIYYQPLRVFDGTAIREVTDKHSILFDPLPPHNVLGTTTFSWRDMIESYKVNAGLDYYQNSPGIKKILDRIRIFLDLTPADICQKVGHYFWVNELHRNFRLCNFTPDDRPSKQFLNDFFCFASFLMKTEKKLAQLRTELLEMVKDMRDDREGTKSESLGYYKFAI